MKKFLTPKIQILAKKLNNPLYVVGGFVRNYLIDGSVSSDIDLASPILTEELVGALTECGFNVVAEYRRTGTVVFEGDGNRYEFTSFRTESYLPGGTHTPDTVIFTKDIMADAKRRDFTCNAVYYDIKNDKFLDPLLGIEDINNRVLKTTVSAKEVFSHDGLRLMRLARFCGELNFTIGEQTFESAILYAKNVKDVAVERIYQELKMILLSDKKYPFSNPNGHYEGLKVLDKIGVLDIILPELTLGRGMEQRKDFHNHDVLEHSLRCVLYAEPSIRLYALIHDIGKPFAMQNYGKYHTHAKDGEKIAKTVLERLKVDNETVKKACFLVGAHMLDLKEDMRENKIRRLIVQNNDYFNDLINLKRADYRACKDQSGEPKTVKRWKSIKEKMEKDGTPFNFSDLKITASELMEMGYKGKKLGDELKKLFWLCIDNPDFNNKEKLLKIAEKGFALDKNGI